MADICLREFGLLLQSMPSVDSLDVCCIKSDEAWDFFENLALSDAKNNRFIRLTSFEGKKALQLRNFVGVICAPDGTQVEILPKTTEGVQDLHATRAVLWKMLSAVEDLRFLETTEARLKLRDAPLSEALVSIFLDHVATLARRGIRRDYERVEHEERFLHGRLRVQQQMRSPPGRQHLFPIEYDLFSENRAENRLLHSALVKVTRTSKAAHNQRLARELRHGFESVPLSTSYQTDFRKWRSGREMIHYQPVLPWLKLILNQLCPFSLRDEHTGVSFLFPMETLFEKYVAHVLEHRLLPRQISVRSQMRTKYLAEHPRAFQLRPDIVLFSRDTGLCVIDTKWKLIDQSATYDDGSDDPKAGIAQGDMYQLFAYGQKYLDGKGRLALIYPKWGGFNRPLARFRLAEGLMLDVVPFGLEKDECVLIDELLGTPASFN